MGRQPNTQCCLCLLSEYLFLSVFCSAQSEQCDTAKRGCSLYPTFFFFFLTNYLGRVKYKNILSALFFLVMHRPFVLFIFSKWSALLKSLFQQRFLSVEFVECFLKEHDWTGEKEMLQRHKIVLNPISFTSDPPWHQMCEVKTISEVNYTSLPHSIRCPAINPTYYYMRSLRAKVTMRTQCHWE